MIKQKDSKQSIDDYWESHYGEKCPYQRSGPLPRISRKESPPRSYTNMHTNRCKFIFTCKYTYMHLFVCLFYKLYIHIHIYRSLEVIENDYENMNGFSNSSAYFSRKEVFSETFSKPVRERNRALSASITRKINSFHRPEFPSGANLDNHLKSKYPIKKLFRSSSTDANSDQPSSPSQIRTFHTKQKGTSDKSYTNYSRPSSPYMKQLSITGHNSKSSTSYHASVIRSQSDSNEDRAVNQIRACIDSAVLGSKKNSSKNNSHSVSLNPGDYSFNNDTIYDHHHDNYVNLKLNDSQYLEYVSMSHQHRSL